MTLPTRPLGSSGLEITTVGFGAWAIGGGGWAFGWGAQDDADSLAAMRRALELGINWIDTAAVYGLGHSEEVVGRLLRELPVSARPLVFTKCGLVWDARDPMKEARRVLRPDSIRKECEASLRRLGVERIDLYQFHWPDEAGTPVEDSWQAMVRLAEEGKVRAAGVSNFDVPRLERCEAIRHVDSLQPPFSLIRREAAEREIPWCAERETGVIVYSPMQSGLLTDSFTAARVGALAPDDRRRRRRRCGGPRVPWGAAHPHSHFGERGRRAASPYHPPDGVGIGAGQVLDAGEPAADQSGRVRGADASQRHEARGLVCRACVRRAQVGAVGELRHGAPRDPEHIVPAGRPHSRDHRVRHTRQVAQHRRRGAHRPVVDAAERQ